LYNATPEGTATPLIPELERIFPGDSEMARRMRAFDWSHHDLGLPTTWPQSLKTAIRIILTSRQAMFTWWGSSLVNLYNDAYIPVLGAKHPDALGNHAPDIWHEIWHVVGPRAEQALTRDEGTYDEALLLLMERNGFVEETYFTFSYSPIVDDEGGYGGIFSPVTEDTQRIIGERQLALLRELSVRTADARTWQDACTLSAAALAANPHDIYWALIYMIDVEENVAVLSATAGVQPGCRAAPRSVPLRKPAADGNVDGGGCPWPLAAVARTRQALLIEDLVALPPGVVADLPAGVRGLPAARAIAIPIAPAGALGKAGILVVGLSPLRLWDDNYQRFLDLVTGEIAAAIANGHAYAEERRRAEALAELDRAKTTFFSNVSHEFRTPLSLMLGPLDDLLHDDLPVAAHRQIDMVHRNALRLLKLVNTLLDFARIEAARMQADYEPVDLARLTADLAATFRSAVERAGMRLIVGCPPLPQPVYVDREMWEKIVLNLLSNAFKFTFEGEIEVSLRWLDGNVELAVRDTGTGIPPAELPRIFERFHRAPSARGRTIEGTGIGLALVKELVRLHGGTIEAASVVDQGSVFTVSLPTGSQHLPAEHIGRERTHASTALGAMPFVEEALRWLPDGDGQEDGDGLAPAIGSPLDYGAPRPADGGADGHHTGDRILVADDNADMRLYLRHLLGTRWQVETVADGAAALQAAAARPPDLVLTDIMMPGMDGLALLAHLRGDPRLREIPVILLSARAGDEARIEGMMAGADDYLVKPFSARELLARVQAHLELARVRRESAAALRASEDRLRALSQSLEARVQERTLELARSNRELDQFAYIASHDLKAPLRAIEHLAAWISQDAADALPPTSQEHLQKLRSRIRRMEQLLDDLLAYSRAGRHLHAPEWVDAETLVRDVGFMLAPPPGFALDVQRPLPRLYTERVPLETVLRNLVGNAIKHHDRLEQGWVRVAAEDKGDWVEFTVADNGPGIDPQHHTRIFQVFQTLRPRDQVEGSGIGLAVVKKTVENQGGEVSIAPHAGRGATFCFTWPKRSPA
jgi:signal transduction histidine kinase